MTTPFSERRVASLSLFGTPSKRTSCLCPAAAPAYIAVSLYLCFGVPDFGAESAKTQLYKALQSKGRNLTTPQQERQRGTTLRRHVMQVPKTESQRIDSLRGFLRGEPLRQRFGDFAAEGKVTRRRLNQPKGRYRVSLPHCGTAKLKLPDKLQFSFYKW